MVGLLVDGQWRTHHQWRHRVLSYARDLLHECNILFQIQQLHIAEGSRRSYNGSGWMIRGQPFAKNEQQKFHSKNTVLG